ncbi:MAG: HAD-IA family hydrolase [Candidatus Peregrinibacteria bacterium]
MHALLFDLDGTLVDTVPLWVSANVAMLARYGFAISNDAFLKNYYHTGLHYTGILEKAGIPLERAAKFYADRDRLYEGILGERAEWVPGAENVLTELSARLTLGMLTGSKRSFIDALDRKLRLSSYFKVIVTYDDTQERIKPDPFGLELLTQKLNVDPRECWYVGDQLVDITAAHAMGMKVCLLRVPSTPENAAGADREIEKIGEVLSLASS